MEPTLDATVRTCLIGVNLEKYIPLFEKHMVSIELFMSMNEDDLRFLGIENIDELEILMKYMKMFKRTDILELTNSILYEEIEKGFVNVSNQLGKLRSGIHYVQEELDDSSSIDFNMNENTATHYIQMMLDRVQEECTEFSCELKSLLDTPVLKEKHPSCMKTCISLVFGTSVAIVAVVFFYQFQAT